jgi:hypothetical protein
MRLQEVHKCSFKGSNGRLCGKDYHLGCLEKGAEEGEVVPCEVFIYILVLYGRSLKNDSPCVVFTS